MNHSEAGKLGAAKSKETSTRQKQERIDLYNLNPTLCKNCDGALTYEQRHNKFCNRSCAATINNNGVRKHGQDPGLCPVCSKPKPRQASKYCGVECYKLSNLNKGIAKINNPADNTKIMCNETIRKYLILQLGNKCQRCGWCEVNPTSGKVPIELEHIDGNSTNNDLSNLTLLCPNCHSLTSTYKALNVGNGRHSRRQRYRDGKSF